MGRRGWLTFRTLYITVSVKNGYQEAILTKDGISESFKCPTIGKTQTYCYLFEKIISYTDYDLFVFIDDDIKINNKDLKMQFEYEFYLNHELGVLFGNRRFTYTENLAGYTKQLWGEIARPVMETFGIACGCYMGIRRTLIPEFLDFWNESVFDDTAAKRICQSRRFQLEHFPDLRYLIEPEPTNWGEFWEFSVRQYADVKTCGPWGSLLFLWACFASALAGSIIFLGWHTLTALAIFYLFVWMQFCLKKNLKSLLSGPILHGMFLFQIPFVHFNRVIKWKHLAVDTKLNKIIKVGAHSPSNHKDRCR